MPTVLGCRYSIRDVGFVDLEDHSFELRLTVSQETEDFLDVDVLKRAAKVAFTDSNIRFRVTKSQQTSRFEMIDSEERVFSPLSFEQLTEADPWALMNDIATSVLRNRLLDASLDAYCVVLLVEGKDETLSTAALESIQRSQKQIESILPKLPKPVDKGPVLLRLSNEDAIKERLTLWSLGFDWQEREVPQVAVIHGRGRRIGKVLSGPMITSTELTKVMTIIGQDCECGLDRAWMQGPTIPVSWTKDRRQKAYALLKFDTEDPMVKTEMSRIIARGAEFRGSQASDHQIQLPGESSSDLGYAESGLGKSDSFEDIADQDIDALLASLGTSVEPTSKPAAAVNANTSAEQSGEISMPRSLIICIISLVFVSLGAGIWTWMRTNR